MKNNKKTIFFCNEFYGTVLYAIAHKENNFVDYSEIEKHLRTCKVCNREINKKYEIIKNSYGLFSNILPNKII